MLFLVWLVPILEEMERRIVEVVLGVGLKFPWYIDDLPYGLYGERRASRCMHGNKRREAMGEIVDRVSKVVKEVVIEWNLPLAENK